MAHAFGFGFDMDLLYNSPAWTPLNLSGVLLWVRADSGITDRSGHGDLDQGSYSLEPTGYNGKPSLKLNGSSNWLGQNGGALCTHATGTDKPFTLLMAAQFVAVTGTTILAEFANTNPAAHDRDDVYQAAGVCTDLRVDTANVPATHTMGHTFDTNRHRYAIVFDGTTRQLYVDNVGKGAVSTNVGAIAFDLFTLGAARIAGTPTNFANIRFADIVFLDHAANATELSKHDEYLVRQYS